MIKRLFLLLFIIAPFSMAYSYFETDNPIMSGPYFGVGGSFAWVRDKLQYNGTVYTPNITTKTKKSQTGFGEAFIGYGHVFGRGNLPYLALELGFNYPAHYHNTGINNEKINAEEGFYLDIMPGMFLDDDKTILVYTRLGAEINRFEFHDGITKKHNTELLYRAGGGIEHEIINNFFIRAGYTIMAMSDYTKFKLNGNLERYRAKPLFHKVNLDFLYKVPLY